eukprot:974269-Rhodomonas_salina.4
MQNPKCGLCSRAAACSVSCAVCSPPPTLPSTYTTFVSSWGSDGSCLRTAAPQHGDTRLGRTQGRAAAWLAEQSSTDLDHILATDSRGLVSFDDGSVRPSTLLDDGDGNKVIACSNQAAIWKEGKVRGQIAEPLFRVTASRGEGLQATDFDSLLQESILFEKSGFRVPGWRMQESLSQVDSASLVLGVPALGLSPVVHGWQELDPALWTETQSASFTAASSGVVFLQGEQQGVERFLSRLRSASVQAKWIVVYPTQFKTTISQQSVTSLLVFGKCHTCWTTKIPVWQGHSQWSGQLGFIQTGGTGAQIFTTGPRDMERIQRLLSLGTGFDRAATEDEWVLDFQVASSRLDLFLQSVEASSYEFGDHVLAATDGSVRQSDGMMGAGCMFAVTNDEPHQGSHNCSVSWEAASLRAEAVALDLLLDHTDPCRKLVALTDSLSLMLILDGWDSQDFILQAEFQKHKDVIVPLAVKLAAS